MHMVDTSRLVTGKKKTYTKPPNFGYRPVKVLYMGGGNINIINFLRANGHEVSLRVLSDETNSEDIKKSF